MKTKTRKRVLLAAVLAALCILLLGGMYAMYRASFYHTGFSTDYRETWPPYQERREELFEQMTTEPSEEVQITSDDGLLLKGHYYCNQEGAPLVLFFHGYKTYLYNNSLSVFDICRKLGYNLLIVSQRAQNESDGHTITMGLKERYDCLAWANWAADRSGRETPMFLMGTSMGGGTVMMASALELPSNVRAIVEDCGFSSPSVIYRKYIGDIVPQFLVGTLYQLGRCGARLFGGFHIKETDCLTAPSQTDLPVLFIHGEGDQQVPCWMAEECYQAAAGDKQLLLIPEADHTQAYYADTERYMETITAFFEKYL